MLWSDLTGDCVCLHFSALEQIQTECTRVLTLLFCLTSLVIPILLSAAGLEFLLLISTHLALRLQNIYMRMIKRDQSNCVGGEGLDGGR